MYEIVDVTAEAGQIEPMGSKPKFWFDHPEWGSCLFKAARQDSGEDWSEKIAERLANRLRIPHARYEMATYEAENGIVTPRITSDTERLVHGNELLIDLDPDYEAGRQQYRTPLHTVDAVFNALREHEVDVPRDVVLPEAVTTCGDVLTGYLLLDALIGNTDRHHENWAVVETVAPDNGTERRLCPTFDHASSLGRNESENRMKERLETKDRGFTVEAYARRARSALHSEMGADRPLSPLDAFARAAALAPAGAKAWCIALASLDDEAIRQVVMDIPPVRMSATAKDFVIRMVCFNRDQLESLCQSL